MLHAGNNDMTKCRRTDDGANNVIAFKMLPGVLEGKNIRGEEKKNKLNNPNLLSIDAVANR